MAARQKDGTTLRDHLEASARAGSNASAAQLVEPDFPDELGYLLVWANALVGRSGAGMAGLAPLSHAEVMAWAALSDTRPEPWEVGALMELDAALRWREPDEEEKPAEKGQAAPAMERAWPTRKQE